MPKPSEITRRPKASRPRVFEAVERIVRAGRRPTVAGVRELLGGGSPNSVTAYINDWYQELGSRLEASDAPLPGLPREAVALLADLWRVATSKPSEGLAASPTALHELQEAERRALLADVKANETLNAELKRHRASAEKSLAEARALLARIEGALAEERATVAELDQALVQMRFDRDKLAARLEQASTRIAVLRKRPDAPTERRSRARAGTSAAVTRPKSMRKPIQTRKTASKKRVAKKRRTTRGPDKKKR